MGSMGTATAVCPADEALQQLLDGTLPAGNQPTVEAHVETCGACQQALDRLTAFATAAWLPDGERPASTTPRPTITHYELLEELGRGGYGVVYRASDTRLGRTVAVKVLKQGALADDADRRRFLTEARAAARLNHPNVVGVYEVGEAAGTPYIAMEYLAGGPLSRRLDGTPLPARAAAELVETLARAVAYAHGQGVVHRDLKPGNVLLASGGREPPGDSPSRSPGASPGGLRPPLAGTPKVADFGTARLLDAPADLTPTQAVLGTPSYMAPEQAGGLSRQVGPAADVYSLGAILYELLAGRPPFRAATPFETLVQVRGQEPVAPRRLNPTVPRDLETIALKCLEKDPARRYPSAAELADDLRLFLDGRPIRARPVGVVGKLVRTGRRHPAVATLSAALVVLVLGSLVTVTVLWRRSVERGERAANREALAVRRQAAALEILDFYTRAAGARLNGTEAPSAAEREALLAALDRYRHLLADGEADPAARYQVAVACRRVSEVFQKMREFGRAEQVDQYAVPLLEQLTADAPDVPEYGLALCLAYHRRWFSANSQRRPDEADAWAARSVRVADDLVRRFPDREGLRDRAVWQRFPYIGALRRAGRDAEADAELARAIADAQTLADARPDDVLRQILVCGLRDQEAAEHEYRRGNPEPGRAHLEYKVKVADRLASHWPAGERFPIELLGHLQFANVLAARGRWAEARDVYDNGLTIAREQAATFSNLPNARAYVAEAAGAAGHLGWEADRGRARQALREARAQREWLAQGSKDMNAVTRLAVFLATCPDPDLQDVPRAVALVRQYPWPAAGDYNGLRVRGVVLCRNGEYAEAAAALERSLSPGVREAEMTVHESVARCALATAYWRLGHPDRARAELNRAHGLAARNSDYNRVGQSFEAEPMRLMGLSPPHLRDFAWAP
jgi:tetratricopeptide (TPR) repeat protein